MNNKLIAIYCVSVCIVFNACQRQEQAMILIEAETSHSYSLSAIKDTTASCSVFLQMPDTGQVAWSFNLGKAGYHDVVIRYRSAEGDKAQILIINNKIIPIGFEMAETWHLFSQPFYFSRGSNSLILKTDWGHMDIDWMGVRSVKVFPQIVPHQAVFYQNHPQPIRFKIDNWHQTIQAVHMDHQTIEFDTIPYPYQESAIWLEIPSQPLSGFAPGQHKLMIEMERSKISAQINIMPETNASGLVMVAPDVNHGANVILQAPTGRYLMIDCGKAWVRDSILVPLLERHHIDTVHTLILTHYHEDHDSGDRGQTIIHRFHVQNVIDYQTFPTGYVWHPDSLSFKILNSYENGEDENHRSLALRICYHDFNYLHDGDIYADNQARILSQFPDDIHANVYAANHHFHGSVNPEYIMAVNPDVVLIQAQEAIYARPAYMVKYRRDSLEPLNKHRSIPVESLASLEVGATVIRINSRDDWMYETYRNQDEVLIPGFGKISKGSE